MGLGSLISRGMILRSTLRSTSQLSLLRSIVSTTDLKNTAVAEAIVSDPPLNNDMMTTLKDLCDVIGFNQLLLKRSNIDKETPTLKDIRDEIGYNHLSKYLFPSPPLKLPNFDKNTKDKVDDDDETYDDDDYDECNNALDFDGHLISDRLHKVCTSVKKDNRLHKEKFNNGRDFSTSFDVIQLLRGGAIKGKYLLRMTGEMVEHEELRGKYVAVCCASIPDVVESNAWMAVAACHELYKKMPGNFEMVIVGNMRSGWSDDRYAFNNFLSVFPNRCLFVPFDDKSVIRRICFLLGLSVLPLFILLDPHGDMLLYHGVDSFDSILLVPWFGSSTHPFPFIRRFFKQLPSDADDCKRPSSLKECLCTEYVFRMKYLPGEALVSDFNSKMVGLYLYCNGDLLPLVRKMDQACRQGGKELEIVLMYLPMSINTNPFLFPKLLSELLAQQNLSWWVAPFDFSAYCILSHFFWGEDKMLIMEPNTTSVDPRGADFFEAYGIDAYPFTESSGYKL